MGFEMVKESYSGSIKKVTLGQGDKAVTIGGESCLPFYDFEGEMPNKPKIAMEIWDMEPEEWPEWVTAPFKDCLGDPAASAKKCVEEYGADLVTLQLKSTDPNTHDTSADQAVSTVQNILEAIDVPLVIWGTANVDKDAQVLKKVAEAFDGKNLVIGPIEDANHKAIGAAVMGYKHTAISSSPIDVNLAKQVNILLENLGVSLDKVIIDPTTGGLGYGLEYAYSVMERIKLAALTFGDDKLQQPIINNLGNEIWRSKEAKQPVEENQLLGDPERRAILMETVGAVAYLMAGSDLLIMRHPEAVRMVRSFIDLLVDGGQAQDISGINKLLADTEIDYASLAPEPDLTIEEEKKPAAKKAEKKEEKPAAEAKPKAEEKPAAEAKPKAEEKPEPKAEAKPEPETEAKPAAKEAKPEQEKPQPEAKAELSAEEKAKAEAEEKAKAEAEAKAKAEAEEKAKREAEEKAKKEAEEKAKREAEEKVRKEAEAKAKLEEDEKQIRQKVQKQQKQADKKTEANVPEELPEGVSEKILLLLDHIHHRSAK